MTVGIHTGSLGTGGLDAGLVGITRLAPQDARAEQVLGTTDDGDGRASVAG
ncbi:MAG TPA: hypothetical protein VHH72_05810 [Solirubrobacterales bacterium]|nr:hypothetical protein [Solirubrobacterales bacterium]